LLWYKLSEVKLTVYSCSDAVNVVLKVYLFICLFICLLKGCLFTELHVQFAQFDKDGDGRITPEEFISVMTSLGYTVDTDKADSMLRAADTDSK